jgi:hypothetical protein
MGMSLTNILSNVSDSFNHQFGFPCWLTIITRTFRDFFSLPSYSAEEWAGVLLLAHKYIITDIETGALTQLESSQPPLDRIKMIELSQKIQSKELYQKAVREFVESRSKIRFEDICKMGVDAFYDIHSLYLYGRSDRPGAPNFNLPSYAVYQAPPVPAGDLPPLSPPIYYRSGF